MRCCGHKPEGHGALLFLSSLLLGWLIILSLHLISASNQLMQAYQMSTKVAETFAEGVVKLQARNKLNPPQPHAEGQNNQVVLHAYPGNRRNYKPYLLRRLPRSTPTSYSGGESIGEARSEEEDSQATVEKGESGDLGPISLSPRACVTGRGFSSA